MRISFNLKEAHHFQFKHQTKGAKFDDELRIQKLAINPKP